MNYNKKTIIRISTTILLNILMPGLGFLARGRVAKAIVIYILTLSAFSAMAVGFTKVNAYSYVVMLSLIFVVLFWPYLVIASIRTAKKPENELKVRPLIKNILLIGLLILNAYIMGPLKSQISQNHKIEAVRVSSGGMMPTLLIGDQILVDKGIYESRVPQKGDIIVFTYPKDSSRMFIQRIVAVGGDNFQIKNKSVFVNGQLDNEPYILHADSNGLKPDRDNFAPTTIPPDSFFIMGDNRDKSYDSRFWGVVPKGNIIGKAVKIYWSWDKTKSQVRWNRIGKNIN